jgi:hypothetical protein
MIYTSNKRYLNNNNIENGADIEKNEEFFWNINSVQDLINAERDGFPRFRLSTSSKMPMSSMLHQAARICNLGLIEEFMLWGEFDVNELDGNNCTPLGYIINEVLENNLKNNNSAPVSTIYDGCNDAEQIIEAISLLQQDDNVKCVYLGKKYSNDFIRKYKSELKKHIIQINGFSRYETAKLVWNGELEFNSLPLELVMDKKFATIVLINNGILLREMDESLKKDKDVVMTAVSDNLYYIQYADETLKKNKEIVMAAFFSGDDIIKYIDKSLRNDRDIALKIVEYNADFFTKIGSSLKLDIEIVTVALRRKLEIFLLLDDSIKNDKSFIIKFLEDNSKSSFGYDDNIVKFFDSSLKKDKKFILEVLKINGNNLEFIDKRYRKNEKMVLEAITNKPNSILLADKSLLENRDFILKAVNINGFVLTRVPISFQKDRQIVLAAVKSRPEVFKYVYEDFKQDKEIKKLSRNGLRY